MAVTTELPPQMRAVQRNRVREQIAHLDYLRSLAVAAHGAAQRQLADVLGISQAAVSKTLRSARAVPPVREGFSGAGPYEIAQRYAAGELTREQVVDELVRWQYEPMPRTDGWDDLLVIEPGTFEDVAQARRHGLIEDSVYDEVWQRRRAAR